MLKNTSTNSNEEILRKDLPYIIALIKLKGVGPVASKQLIAYCGGASEVFQTSARTLSKIPGIGEAKARLISKSDPEKLANEELNFLSLNNEIRAISFLDESYPRRLKPHDDAPILLFYKGNHRLNSARTVGIVGTRTPSEYGRLQCDGIVEGLQGYGITIISGLAYGIDSIAHRKSIAYGIPTIGVLGHGLDRIYPVSNTQLSERMISGGGLLTEFPSGTNPDRENFPMRNRIIAALSDALIVVESKERGGSIITAELANSYHKDVFALPGRNTDDKSKGCNSLIKSHKAAMIESSKDLCEMMRWNKEETQTISVQPSLFQDLGSTEQEVITLLQKSGECSIDHIHYTLKLPISELSSILLSLEFKGVIASLPGKRYIIK